MRKVWAVILVISLTGGACTTVNLPEAPTPGPDRVVGIEVRCTILSGSDVFEVVGETRCREAIENLGASYLSRHVKVLTIRTSGGSAYTVAVDGDQSVALGDAWP